MNLGRIVSFAGVSGAGLCLDYLIYTLLCSGGMTPGLANLISAATAVTFVFAVSVRRIFTGGDRRMTRLFSLYVVYQIVAVSLASYAVELATNALDGRFLLGKTAILPVSFTANYLFMSWLLSPPNPHRTA